MESQFVMPAADADSVVIEVLAAHGGRCAGRATVRPAEFLANVPDRRREDLV
jgi:hypothetical protein